MHIPDTTDTVNRLPQRPIARCLAVVARHYGLRVADLRRHDRRRKIMQPRQLAFWLASQTKLAGFAEIGRYVGGFDHTTVLHAIHRVESRRADALYRALSDALLSEVRGRSTPLPESEPEPELPKGPETPKEPRWMDGTAWYHVGTEDERYWPAFMMRQNERFCAAMTAALAEEAGR